MSIARLHIMEEALAAAVPAEAGKASDLKLV
jgi:hypothetical protein